MKLTAKQTKGDGKNCKTQQQFSVKVLKQGVGGFAVGFACASFPKPYKSVGKHPKSFVFHSSGSTWHNSQEMEGWDDKGFGEQDIVTCILTTEGAVMFAVNGGEPREAFDRDSVKHCPQLLPVVQPYMGGVAVLL
jgi:hypothetical protein